MPKILQATKKFVIQFSDILRTSAYLMMPSPSPTCLNMQHLGIGLWPLASQYAVPNRTNQLGTRNFPGKTSKKKQKFTANANQWNENAISARVPGTEVCACHSGIKFYHSGNRFLPPRKLIFNTPEFEFYHRGNWFLTPRNLNFTTAEID